MKQLRAVVEKPRQRGAALIVVLWTFAVLSVLAAEYARAMRQEAQSTLNFKQEVVAHYTAVAGINEAILAIRTYNGELEVEDDDPADIEDDDSARRGRRNQRTTNTVLDEEEDDDPRLDAIKRLVSGRGEWVESRFNGRPYELRVFDESGKIPINAAGLEEAGLMKIFENLDIDESDARDLADAILDWRDEDDNHRLNGAETDYYEGLDIPYRAKNAPFDAVEELLLVKGVTRDLFYGVDGIPGFVDIFTVSHASARMAENAIPGEVEYALCGSVDEDTEDEDDQLGVGDGEQDIAVGTCIQDIGLGTRNSARNGRPNLITARIEARVKDEGDRVLTHIGVVIRLKNDSFQTYQWYDAVFDGHEGA